MAYPTEAVFGLGCDPNDLRGVLRILEIKQRSVSQGLILIGADVEQFELWIDPTPEESARLAKQGERPISWVVTAKPGVPDWITGGRESLAVRITSHPIARALCRSADSALVSTSANVHRRPPATSALQVRRRLGDRIDFILPGTVGEAANPSEIRIARSGKTIRPG